jgi:hypothetical protein
MEAGKIQYYTDKGGTKKGEVMPCILVCQDGGVVFACPAAQCPAWTTAMFDLPC